MRPLAISVSALLFLLATAISASEDAASLAGGEPGLRGEYFSNRQLTGIPALERVDAGIDFDWGEGSPDSGSIGADQLSVRWSGYLVPASSGQLRLIVNSDDGVRVWIDGRLVIDRWTDQPASDAWSEPFAVIAGEKHHIRLEYYENFVLASIRLDWVGEGFEREPIPASSLATGGAFSVDVPETSYVSPAFIEGFNRVGLLPAIEGKKSGQLQVADQLNETQFFGNVALEEQGQTKIKLVAGGESLTAKIKWVPVSLDDPTPLVVRVDDEVLFKVGKKQVLTVLRSCGIAADSRTDDDRPMRFKFEEPDRYTVVLTRRGVEIARRDIIALSATVLNERLISGLWFTRTTAVAFVPTDVFGTVESGLPGTLDVQTTPGEGVLDVSYQPRGRGDLRIVARTQPHGPIIATWPVEEFSFESDAKSELVLNAETELTYPTLTLRPYVPNIWFDFSMYAETATFAGGRKNMSVSTSGETVPPDSLPPVTGEAFRLEFDQATGEYVGRFTYEVMVVGDKACHFITPGFLDTSVPLPATEGQPSDAAPPDPTASDYRILDETDWQNPHICKVSVERTEVVECINAPLKIHLITDGEGGVHRVISSAGSTGDSPPNLIDDEVNCQTGVAKATVDVHSWTLRPPKFPGKYDVAIGGARFSDRIWVLKGTIECRAEIIGDADACVDEAYKGTLRIHNDFCHDADFHYDLSIATDDGGLIKVTPASGDLRIPRESHVDVPFAMGPKNLGVHTITALVTHEDGTCTESLAVEVGGATPDCDNHGGITIDVGERATIAVDIVNVSQHCKGSFTWSATSTDASIVILPPDHGRTGVLQPGGKETIHLSIKSNDVPLGAADVTIHIEGKGGSVDCTVPVTVNPGEPVNDDRVPTMRMGVTRMRLVEYADNGVAQRYEIDIAAQLLHRDLPQTGVLLEASVLPDAPGTFLVGMTSTFGTPYSSASAVTDENGMVFLRYSIATVAQDAVSPRPKLWLRIADQSYISAKKIDQIAIPSTWSGRLGEPQRNDFGDWSSDIPSVDSQCGQRPDVVPPTAILAAAAAPLPGEFGFAAGLFDLGPEVTQIIFDQLWNVSRLLPPFVLLNASGLTNEEAKAAFFGFLFGVPNGVVGWGKGNLEGLKALVTTLPKELFIYIFGREDIYIDVGEKGGWGLRIPGWMRLTLPSEQLKVLEDLVNKFTKAAQQIADHVSKLYAGLKAANFAAHAYVDAFVPEFDQKLAAHFFTGIYHWASDSSAYNVGAVGYLTGVVFGFVLTEVVVDVVITAVTAGVGGVGRVAQLAAEASQIPKLIRLMQEAKFVSQLTTRVRTLFGISEVMAGVGASEAKLVAITTKFTEASEAGKFGGMIARMTEAAGTSERAKQVTAALAKVIEATEADIVGDVMRRLARVVDDTGRNVVFTAEEVEKAGLGIRKLSRLEKDGHTSGIDIELDLLGVRPGDGVRIADRGFSDDLLRKFLVRSGEMSAEANQAALKVMSKLKTTALVDPETLRIVGEISALPDLVQVEKFFLTTAKFTDNAAFSGLRKIALEVKAEDLARYVDRPGVRDPLTAGRFEQSFKVINGLADTPRAEVARLLKDLPRTSADLGAIGEDLALFLTNPNITNEIPKALEGLAAMRSGGKLPPGVLERAGPGSTSLLKRLGTAPNRGFPYEPVAMKKLIENGITSPSDITVVSKTFDVKPIGVKEGPVEMDAIALINEGSSRLRFGLDMKLRNASTWADQTTAGRIAELIRLGEIDRFQYVVEGGRIVPAVTQDIFRQINVQLSHELNPDGVFTEFLKITPINGGAF